MTLYGFTPLGPAALTQLKRLRIVNPSNDNAIIDVSPLGNLIHLKELFLDDNSISDISPLTVLTHLSWLVVVGNPLNDDTFNVVNDMVVNDMRANGTKVTVVPRLDD